MEQNLSSYRAFYAVANTGNISHAANELYISQPAISKSIRRLEERLGVSLFYRTSKGVSLTQEGEILYTHVQKAFEELSQGEEQLRMFQEFGMGQVRIGASATLCKYVLLSHLNHYLSRHPHIQVTIECQSSQKTLEMLEQKQIDLGLVGISRPLKNYRFRSMGQIHDIFVAKPSYLENLQERELGSNDALLSNATLMLLDKNNMTRRFIDTYFSEHKLTPGHTLEVTTMDLLIEFAKVGLGIACVIREFVQDELQTGALVEIPLEIDIPPREIGYAYSKSQISSAVQDFL